MLHDVYNTYTSWRMRQIPEEHDVCCYQLSYLRHSVRQHGHPYRVLWLKQHVNAWIVSTGIRAGYLSCPALALYALNLPVMDGKDNYSSQGDGDDERTYK